MARLFDAYIIVDWSAASKPAQGANSVWIGALARDARLKFQFQAANPSTRLAARDMIAGLAERFISRFATLKAWSCCQYSREQRRGTPGAKAARVCTGTAH